MGAGEVQDVFKVLYELPQVIQQLRVRRSRTVPRVEEAPARSARKQEFFLLNLQSKTKAG